MDELIPGYLEHILSPCKDCSHSKVSEFGVGSICVLCGKDIKSDETRYIAGCDKFLGPGKRAHICVECSNMNRVEAFIIIRRSSMRAALVEFRKKLELFK